MAVYRFVVTFVVIVSLFAQTFATNEESSTKCYSRFDFEEKLLEKMVKVEHEVKVLKENWRRELEVLSAGQDVSGTVQKLANVKEKHQAQLNELIALGAKIKRERTAEQLQYTNSIKHIEGRASLTLSQIQSTKTSMEREFRTMYRNSEAKLAENLHEIKALANRSPVMLRARFLHSISPGPNTRLRFTNVLSDTSKTYNPATGEFKAPVNGTYLFNVGICHTTGKNVNIQVIANGAKLTDTSLYNQGGYTCGVVQAASGMKQGERAYIYSGSNTYRGTSISQNSYSWNTFTVILVN